MGEQLGVPSVAVMTEEFVDAAQLMAVVLGAEGHRFAVIEHPIASATVEQLRSRAERAATDCVRLLTTEV